MPDDPSTQSDPRIETGSRARELPKEAHITKSFDKFQDFVDMYRSRISLGGAFVDTETLRPVGSEVYLDFRLHDGYRLLYGLAEVVWVRLKTMGDRPKGMGLRFLSLDESGRELVLKLLEEQVKSGGAPFEVDRVPEDGSIDPTVVQALAGPSAEENEAAQRAKTGSRPAEQPESEDEAGEDGEEGEELPDLPPGVLPPPDDEEPDFSAPWGSQLPEIPGELLEESSATSPEASDGPSIPAVEAPESPYAPGSDSHDEQDQKQEPQPDNEPAQADLAFEPPPDGGDPHLDETDFGGTAAVIPPDASPDVQPVGGVTSLQDAQGDDPFGDFDDQSVPEVDGTLFQLPDSETATESAASAETAAPAAPEETAASADGSDEAASYDAPSFDEPSFDAPSFEADASTETSPDAGPAFDAPGFDAGGLDDMDFGDDTGSLVAPPPDIGDSAGSAWDPDYEAVEGSTAAGTSESVETSAAGSDAAAATVSLGTGSSGAGSSGAVPSETAGPRSPEPTREESEAMDAAMDIDADEFAFEPPDADLLEAGTEDETAASTPDDRADVATPESVAAAALADQMAEDEPPTQFETQPTPPSQGSSTETADDLFAFRGPPDAQPALDPEETASLRKGALPDLNDTMMGTKASSEAPAEGDDEDLQDSYDDWEEWAPHPTKSGGRTKTLIGVVLLLALVGGASYFFRSTLLPMIGFGGSESTSLGPAAAAETSDGTDDISDDGVEEYQPPDDPLAEPVEVAEPDGEGPAMGDADTLLDDFMGDAGGAEDGADGETANDEPQTQATADSLRPPSTRTDPPPPASTTTPPPATGPPPSPPATTSSGAASQVQSIEVRPGGGATEVVIQLDGSVDAGRLTHDPLAWAADREMVTLLGFENFKQTRIAGQGAHVKQVRVGFHPGNELRLVFDLTSNSVSIQDVQARGNQIVVRLAN